MSWGTEEDTARYLGAATPGRSGKVSVALPDENEGYEDALHVLHNTTKEPQSRQRKLAVLPGQREADYYRNFRTTFATLFIIILLFCLKAVNSVLLAWVLTNALLAALMTGTFTRATPSANAVPAYMAFLLYSMVLLACKYIHYFRLDDIY
jgi:hypothetical protein